MYDYRDKGVSYALGSRPCQAIRAEEECDEARCDCVSYTIFIAT